MLTLASDFGSPYPAAMKGVVLQRTDARLVDVAHDFPRQDVRAAAFWLRQVLAYYPPATHLVVVDPGVGTDRDAIVVRAGEHALVGPDNGVLCPAARRLAGEADLEAFVIDEHRLESPDPTGSGTTANSPVDSTAGSTDDNAGDGAASNTFHGRSNTFHGRDVFAPAAAAVHDMPVEALESLAFLSPADSIVDLALPAATVDGERAVGDVLVVDDFGNAITNVPGSFLEGKDRIRANGTAAPVCRTFAGVDVGDRLATVGSHGYVELDVNRGRGETAFELDAGDRVVLETVR